VQRYCLFLNWQAFLRTFFQKKFLAQVQIGAIVHSTNLLGAKSFFS